jgi:gas vesicle protein
MNTHTQEHQDYSFAIGLLTGVLVGAGLATWVASWAAPELRERITDSARRLGERASNQYQHASARASEAVDELTRKSQAVGDDVAEAVGRVAHEVERSATSGKSDPVTEPRPQPAGKW